MDSVPKKAGNTHTLRIVLPENNLDFDIAYNYQSIFLKGGDNGHRSSLDNDSAVPVVLTFKSRLLTKVLAYPKR